MAAFIMSTKAVRKHFYFPNYHCKQHNIIPIFKLNKSINIYLSLLLFCVNVYTIFTLLFCF